MHLDIPKILHDLTEKQDRKFTYQDNEVSLQQVCAYDGCLPVLVRRANTLCDFLFGSQLNVSFHSDAEALSGERVEVNEAQHTFMFIMLIHDTIEELIVSTGSGDVAIS